MILVGLARCIAMVLIWNDLACGDREMAAVLVALNAVFQVLTYAVLGYFYLEVLPGWLGLDTDRPRRVHVGHRQDRADLPRHPAARRLPDPHARRAGHAAGTGTRRPFLPKIGPIALYGLLFTVVVLFALQGKTITSEPLERRPDRAAAARPTSRSCGSAALAVARWLALTYATHHDPGVHRGQQRLRARDRRRHRRVRRHQRPGAGRRRRPADRGPGPRRPGLSWPCGCAAGWSWPQASTR